MMHMSDQTRRLMLLDTASLYFRAFYGVPSSVRSPDGRPVNAVRGLLDFIARLVTDHQPTDLIACWDDDWRPAFRVAAIPSYKEHRLADPQESDLAGESVPDELIPQVDLIVEALQLLGICRVGAPGYEADDVIGSMAAQTKDPVLVVTGDRDLFQLVDDAQPVRVLYTAAKGVGNAELVSDQTIVDKYGIHAHQYADFALLRGDTSDGLPGVRGIGDKTAASLIAQFGDVDSLIAAVQAGNSGVKAAAQRNLLGSLDYVEAAKTVVRVAHNIQFPPFDSALPKTPDDPSALAEFAERHGLVSSVQRVSTALGWLS